MQSATIPNHNLESQKARLREGMDRNSDRDRRSWRSREWLSLTWIRNLSEPTVSAKVFEVWALSLMLMNFKNTKRKTAFYSSMNSLGAEIEAKPEMIYERKSLSYMMLRTDRPDIWQFSLKDLLTKRQTWPTKEMALRRYYMHSPVAFVSMREIFKFIKIF